MLSTNCETRRRFHNDLGCMAAEGVGEVRVCEGRMNAATYTEMLSEALEPSIYKIFQEDSPKYTFQQDSAPCHTAKSVKKWFADNGVPVMNWPSQSPDLNPIEHLWGEIKRRIRNKVIKNRQDLKNEIFRVWEEIPPSVTQNLVASMPRRVAAVYKNKGGHSKY